jgi:precorrin-2/cobalt-factor-2 C20-methyltransferase
VTSKSPRRPVAPSPCRASPRRPVAPSARRARWGTVYGLGLGPGDPDLITVKAQRILRSVPTLLVPVRNPEDPGYAWAIAEPHIGVQLERVVRLPFPRECEAELDEQWEQNCQQVLECLQQGEDAAFVTEGDPLLYSTFVQVASRLRARVPDLPIEVVPGVSSITAASAAAGESLATRDDRLAVVPAFYGVEDLGETLRRFDTVVLVKVSRVLDEVVGVLSDLGLAERAILVERCGRPEQRIVRGLRDCPSKVDYFSLVIVRK